jgi:hypothetical protein
LAAGLFAGFFLPAVFDLRIAISPSPVELWLATQLEPSSTS